MDILKPIKWVGGKTKILPLILDNIPYEMDNYHEVFLGGGSVLFGILLLDKYGKIQIKKDEIYERKIKINGKIYAYDLNSKLINMFKNIQQNKDLLYQALAKYNETYNSITNLQAADDEIIRSEIKSMNDSIDTYENEILKYSDINEKVKELNTKTKNNQLNITGNEKTLKELLNGHKLESYKNNTPEQMLEISSNITKCKKEIKELNKELNKELKELKNTDEYKELKKIEALKKELKKDKNLYIKRNRIPLSMDEAIKSKESYYYWLRIKFNELSDDSTIEYSALFIFLNKSCFRGVYREGPNGFNVPFGHYDTLAIITKSDMEILSDLIQNVEFRCEDFRNSIKGIKKGDFAYFDPPYVPIKKETFVDYTIDGFGLKTHQLLFDELNKLDDKEINFTLSNSNRPLVKTNFPEDRYNYTNINVLRAINSKNPGDKAEEVIINNLVELIN
jgi:DNA adenine methylase